METSKLNWLKELYPGYFSLCMATGIISIGMSMWGLQTISTLFYVFALLSWFVLVALYSWRLLKFPRQVMEDLVNPKTTFIFFTFVAATNICGLLLYQHNLVLLAMLCWLVSFLVWSLLLYFSFAALSFAHPNREVNVVHGGWLILIVGTQSLVILGTKITHELEEFAGYMMIETLMLWALGLIFYAIFVTLFCYRIFFKDMKLVDYSPLMWVIMGAAAIGANAGFSLIMIEPLFPFINEFRSVIIMLSIILWTWATWWIPLLVIFGLWKHVYHKVKITYDPMQWSIVFPLGMYAVTTYNFSLVIEFEPLRYFSQLTLWVAIPVWVLMMFALIGNLVRHGYDNK